jgi:dTDP-4-dehydrorhamnose 3,5-epimerase
MRVIETALPGVIVIEPEVHRDPRGFFAEIYHAGRLESCGIRAMFVQDNQSRSVQHTIRGLHWQYRRPQAKLVRVINGAILDVAVDIRRGSPTFGRWVAVQLSAGNFKQTFIPEGFAHGFCVLSETADVEYKCTDYYDADGQSGLSWDDPAMSIAWPITAPLLSPKDRAYEPLEKHDRDLPTLSPSGQLIWRC